MANFCPSVRPRRYRDDPPRIGLDSSNGSSLRRRSTQHPLPAGSAKLSRKIPRVMSTVHSPRAARSLRQQAWARARQVQRRTLSRRSLSHQRNERRGARWSEFARRGPAMLLKSSVDRRKRLSSDGVGYFVARGPPTRRSGPRRLRRKQGRRPVSQQRPGGDLRADERRSGAIAAARSRAARSGSNAIAHRGRGRFVLGWRESRGR